MKANLKRRIACLSLSAVMASSLIAGNALAFAKSGKDGLSASADRYDTVTTEDVTGKVSLSGVALENLSSAVIKSEGASASVKDAVKTVVVTLDGDCLLDKVSAGESVSDYASSYSGGRFAKSVKTSQDNLLSTLSDLNIDYKVAYRYSTVTNAVALEVNTKYISKIKSLQQVSSAFVSETYSRPETIESVVNNITKNPSSVYETGIYNSKKYVEEGYNGKIYDGSGTTVAILDTGLDYTHEAFAEMPQVVSFTKEVVEEKIKANPFNTAENGRNITADDVYVNAKVPFAYDYADHDADVYPSYSQHGTHVAGIVAGKADSYTDKDGNVAKDSEGNVLSFRGVAPNAQLVICKVFTDNLDSKDLGGATTEDLIAALEDCAMLDVDIINMSLGTSSGFSSIYIEGDSEGQALNNIYEKLQKRGTSVISAASNEFSSGYGSAYGTNLATNPDSGTVGSPSTFTGAMSVASINGQLSPFMIANDGTKTETPIFYDDSSDANSVRYDFLKQLLYNEKTGEWKTSETFKYVVVPNIGQVSDYTSEVVRELRDKSEGRTIAVISRGSTTFETKINTVMNKEIDCQADAVIIYNNVAGSIGISLGEIENPLPAVSVSMDAGRALCYDENGSRRLTGKITISTSFQAGPFMNDYSSWGSTPDLKLKPEVTAHGGEITSTVAGGYTEMSGTSMATPNLAGFAALLRQWLKDRYPSLADTSDTDKRQEFTRLMNQIMMSTAITVYDREGLPCSPRKQGAGLASLDNVFSTNAYLYTENEENDYRPKVELGEDEEKKGEYTVSFKVKNTGSQTLKFTTQSIFMTETLASDGLAVAEKAHLFTDNEAQWTVGGSAITEGDEISVTAGESVTVTVKLTLSTAEKRYLNNTFENGMFVEGFIKLNSKTEGQCDLTLPYMGFYGDWEAAPMLDYDCYEISEFEQDTSLDENTRPQPSVWATQAYATYVNEKYSIPMGNYLYTQDPGADQIYCDPEHAVISRFNIDNGDGLADYMTATKIKALYAGLLRNAELVTYDLIDTATGEVIQTKEVYRVNKAYSGGGSSVPAQVLMELDPDELGLVNNGKYRLDYRFYFKAEDRDNPEKQNDDNTFSMVFYVDYEAPMLVDSRIRYYDYKENNRDKQRVYLDLDIYDNTYAQSVILCYSEGRTINDELDLKLATPYITPVLNANKNGTTTVSIEITDFYEKYNERLYVQIDDYALNHRISRVSFSRSSTGTLPSQFELVGGNDITVGVNEMYKIEKYAGVETGKVMLDYEGTSNVSNFTWYVNSSLVAKVRNGEIFGVAPGDTTVTIVGANGATKKINVHVVDNGATLPRPAISFNAIENSDGSLVKAIGTVKVNAGEKFKLELVCDPWYYPVENIKPVWRSERENIASVDENGNVQVYDTKGSATISATAEVNGTSLYASVTLSVQDPFKLNGTTLTEYHGTGGTVVIPANKNIMTIGEEAFKDNDNIVKIIIPKTVTQINEEAFRNCTALKEVYFISEEALPVADANLSLIMKRAFLNCTALETLNFTNCKVFTIDREAFSGCTSLKEVIAMNKIGTMNDAAFYGCTSLKKVDATGLHTSGSYVFANCTSIEEVATGFYTAIGVGAFSGCTKLESVTINTANVASGAFERCSSLKVVNFGDKDAADKSLIFNIGTMAFYGCIKLEEVNFNGYNVSNIGDMAFAECDSLTSFEVPKGLVSFGDRVFENTPVTLTVADGAAFTTDTYGAIYSGTKLVLAPKTLPANFEIAAGTTEIGAYAFSGVNAASVTIPASVTTIGEGAFANSKITQLTLPAGIKVIPAYAFAGTAISEFTVGADVESIGAYAFANCANLAEVNFASNPKLASIGEGAFSGCTTLEQITLPDGAAVTGAGVFRGCTSLKTVQLPSVNTLGALTFYGCGRLESVAFGANAETCGDFTFLNCAKLNSVTLGDKTTEIGMNVFSGCTSLKQIDLKNVASVGAYAFADCVNLEEVKGLENVSSFAAYAFANCTALKSLNLESATYIGYGAFANGAYTTLNIPKAEVIGDMAFFGGQESEVKIPVTLKTIGNGAFAKSSKLKSFTVDEGNKKYFAENGVLYRILGVEGGNLYELCAYPSAKYAEQLESVRTYRIKDGTATIQAYAFAYVNAGVIARVIIPYSVKTIGAAAFYAGNISEFRFESINAPVLLTEFDEASQAESYHQYLYYNNFGDEFINHIDFNEVGTPSTVRIYYPTNGFGYDNYIYTRYFGTKNLLGEIIDDTTRSLVNMIKDFVSVDTVKGWNSLEVNETNKKMVEEFSEKVKKAHGLYLEITSETQLGFVGEENLKTLSDVETELKAVKARFGISASVTSMTVSPDSKHKTEYAAGEKFDMNGLELIVHYDDYTTEIADISRLSLAEAYSGGLTVLNGYVVIEGYGVSVMVAVSVDENASGTKGGGNVNVGLIVGLCVGGAVLAAVIAAGVVLALREKKKSANEAQSEEVKTDDTPEDEAAEATEEAVEEQSENTAQKEEVAEDTQTQTAEPEAEEEKPVKKNPSKRGRNK